MKRPPTEAALPWANSDHGHLPISRGSLMPVVPTHGQSFRARLQENHQCAPHKYLSDLRVEEAKRVMLTTKLPLADIALICGFGDQSYFTRVFSRSADCSPGTWRRNNSDG
ncbi:MAG: transcriptional regulator [Bradyrhizobium sp.]|nr:transcriptional regulator [Bradyrhizobium sp.]